MWDFACFPLEMPIEFFFFFFFLLLLLLLLLLYWIWKLYLTSRSNMEGVSWQLWNQIFWTSGWTEGNSKTICSASWVPAEWLTEWNHMTKNWIMKNVFLFYLISFYDYLFSIFRNIFTPCVLWILRTEEWIGNILKVLKFRRYFWGTSGEMEKVFLHPMNLINDSGKPTENTSFIKLKHQVIYDGTKL